MNEQITIQDLAQKTAELQDIFRKIENRPWDINAFLIELTAEVGTLADSIMIKEGYRELRPDQNPIDLEDDICDILFVLFMIADHYKINIGESYLSMINLTLKKLENKINSLPATSKLK
jgi:NTP pyrophosphatase (non-canonical NTP hydrolase)